MAEDGEDGGRSDLAAGGGLGPSLRVREIVAGLEDLIPREMAEDGDNVGLLVGDPEARPGWISVALDASHALVGGKLGAGPGLLVVHHPLPYRPVSRFLTGDPTSDLLAELIRRDISLYAAHTNADLAPGGLSHALALDLGLDPSTLRPLFPASEAANGAGRGPGRAGSAGFYKLVVFVPATHTAGVRAALAGAGAGWIGNYSDTAFAVQGHGYFRPREGANPFVGLIGEVEEAVEDRLETIVPAHCLTAVIRRLLAAHPYEEVAYDVYPLVNHPPVSRPELLTGLGRVGGLSSGETDLSNYRLAVERGLGLKPGGARALGRWDERRAVRIVAVCPGAGGRYVGVAAAVGADVYVTGDLTYHQVVEASERGLALIDAGHYPTERAFTRLVAGALSKDLAAQGIWLPISEVPAPDGWFLS
jgi:dinuclear metal center YbgI/SA1388 family protein